MAARISLDGELESRPREDVCAGADIENDQHVQHLDLNASPRVFTLTRSIVSSSMSPWLRETSVFIGIA